MKNIEYKHLFWVLLGLFVISVSISKWENFENERIIEAKNDTIHELEIENEVFLKTIKLQKEIRSDELKEYELYYVIPYKQEKKLNELIEKKRRLN